MCILPVQNLEFDDLDLLLFDFGICNKSPLLHLAKPFTRIGISNSFNFNQTVLFGKLHEQLTIFVKELITYLHLMYGVMVVGFHLIFLKEMVCLTFLPHLQLWNT